MNSLERVRCTMLGQSVDYPPNFAILLAPACQLTGTPQGQYSQDPHVLADTLIAARNLTGGDGIYVSRDNWVYHQALGGELLFPHDDEPYATRPVLASLEDFRRLALGDPEHAPGMRTLLAAAREVVARAGEACYVQANIDCGPFSVAAVLRGVQNFMMDVATAEPSLLAEYLEFCTEAVISYGRAMIATGVHAIQYGDSVASLVGPDMYRQYALPYQHKSLSALTGRGCDLWLHICGQTEHILPQVAELPIDGFEVDALVDIALARRLLGDRITLKGNLPTTFLLRETPEAVYAATVALLRRRGSSHRLIVSAGCGVPRATPLANLLAISRACKDSGAK
ncbi:MAG: uroporphyrinogen decarboxylase family protein [Planctomycetota bacterium]|nr:uroporphyrinogen decarboxylase family protein [Planctomycetota bacterium]